MTRSIRIAVFLAVAAVGCASVSRRSAPRLSGTVPLQLTVRGSLYTGSAVISDGQEGTFVVAGPVEVKGTLRTKFSRDSVALDLAYTIAANNCKGTMNLAGAFKSRETNVAEGAVTATDSCVGRMTGSFKVGK